MTHVEKGIIIIAKEAPCKCELCGAVEETRPYGPNNEEICFACGEKDPGTTTRKMEERFNSAWGVSLG